MKPRLGGVSSFLNHEKNRGTDANIWLFPFAVKYLPKVLLSCLIKTPHFDQAK